jgi:hypothetical protein
MKFPELIGFNRAACFAAIKAQLRGRADAFELFII